MYNLFLFLHIVGVIVWIGGAVALTVLNLRLAREPSAGVREAIAGTGEFFGRAVFGPAVMLTLIAGVVMIGMLDWAMPAWAIWGVCGLVVSAVVGAAFIGRASRELTQLMAADGPDAGTARIAALRQRVTLSSALNLLILLSVVWVMIFKPTF